MLKELIFEKSPVNPEKLHEDLLAALGEKFVGLSAAKGKVRVHLQDDMPPTTQDKAAPIVAAHDASILTPAQQQDAAQQALLDSLQKPWATWTTRDKDDFLRLLAEKIRALLAR